MDEMHFTYMGQIKKYYRVALLNNTIPKYIMVYTYNTL